MKRNKKVSSLNDEIKQYTQNKKYLQDTNSARLRHAWEKVAPTSALKHCDNILFSNRDKEPVILVYVDSSQWAAELSLQSEILRILLSQELNQAIESIKFQVSRQTAQKIEFKERIKEKPSYIEDSLSEPLSEKEKEKVWETVQKISNSELKTRLFQTIVKDLEWKKGKKKNI